MRRVLPLVLCFLCSPVWAGTVGIQDEGGTTSWGAAQLNCVGAGITCTKSGITGTITVPGGSSSHNILSATHTDSTAASVSRGDLITGQGATPTWSRLAIGVANRYLKSDGTDVLWSSGAASGVGTPTACSNQFVTGMTLNSDAAPTSTCTTATLASAQFANQGTTATVLHGNGAGNPSFSAVSLTADVSGITPVANGGTGLASGTSGGVLGYTATGTLASSAALTASALVLGGGAGATPSTPVGLGTTTTVLHGNAAGNPSFGSVGINDVSGSTGTVNFVFSTSPTFTNSTAITGTSPSMTLTPTSGVAVGIHTELNGASSSEVYLKNGTRFILDETPSGLWIGGNSTSGSTPALTLRTTSSGTFSVSSDNFKVSPSGGMSVKATADNVPLTLIRGTDTSPVANLIEVYKADRTTLLSSMAFDGRWRLSIASASPTIAAGTGAGTGPTVSLTGTDSSGELSITTGTTPTGSNATIATITFNRSFQNAPACVVTPSELNSATLSGTTGVFLNSTTTTFLLKSGSSALTASTAYKWFYHCLGQ